ncbi:hypothetical protein LINPERHAP1_LOCUS9327, partial [Linum perenne]
MSSDDHHEETMDMTNGEQVNEDAAIRKGRGKNKCRALAKLKPGVTLPIQFFKRRAVGENHKVFTRNLGMLVRDPLVLPTKVKKWKELSDAELDHMWASAQEHFNTSDTEPHKDGIMEHMRELWNKWRSKLYSDHVKPCKGVVEAAIKNVPPMMNKDDWAWCVTEVFFSDEYQKKSKINTINR